MFKTTAPVTEPDVPDVTPPAELIPLSVLSLDVAPPVGGWDAYLAGKSIEVVLDDIGRPAIARADARVLIAEHREAESRKREAAERQERAAIEADRVRRASIWGGVPWYDIPAGVTAAEVWAQAEKDARARRRSPLEDALANEGTVYRPLPDES